MVDKSKSAPIPERKSPKPDERRTDPQFVRGTIDPPTKKEHKR